MIEEFDSALLPVTHNTKLQDSEGIAKEISNEEYEKILSKVRTLNPIRELLQRTQNHSEFGIIQLVISLLKLYSGSNNTLKAKKNQQQKSERFQAMTLEQQQIMFTLEEVINLEFNPEILLKRIKITPIQTNLLLILLLTLYSTYISTSEDSTRVIQWIGILYDGSFLKVCLDKRIKETLAVVESILSNEIQSQKQELEVLSIMEEMTENIGYYQELKETAEIETIYVGF